VRRPRSTQRTPEPKKRWVPAARPGRTDQLLASRVIFISAIGDGSTTDGACIGPGGFAPLNVIRWDGTLRMQLPRYCVRKPVCADQHTSPPRSLPQSDAMGVRQTQIDDVVDLAVVGSAFHPAAPGLCSTGASPVYLQETCRDRFFPANERLPLSAPSKISTSLADRRCVDRLRVAKKTTEAEFPAFSPPCPGRAGQDY
jgi:hypothetical protein